MLWNILQLKSQTLLSLVDDIGIAFIRFQETGPLLYIYSSQLFANKCGLGTLVLMLCLQLVVLIQSG